jgi:hypothetical protein
MSLPNKPHNSAWVWTKELTSQEGYVVPKQPCRVVCNNGRATVLIRVDVFREAVNYVMLSIFYFYFLMLSTLGLRLIIFQENINIKYTLCVI